MQNMKTPIFIFLIIIILLVLLALIATVKFDNKRISNPYEIYNFDLNSPMSGSGGGDGLDLNQLKTAVKKQADKLAAAEADKLAAEAAAPQVSDDTVKTTTKSYGELRLVKEDKGGYISLLKRCQQIINQYEDEDNILLKTFQIGYRIRDISNIVHIYDTFENNFEFMRSIDLVKIPQPQSKFLCLVRFKEATFKGKNKIINKFIDQTINIDSILLNESLFNVVYPPESVVSGPESIIAHIVESDKVQHIEAIVEGSAFNVPNPDPDPYPDNTYVIVVKNDGDSRKRVFLYLLLLHWNYVYINPTNNIYSVLSELSNSNYDYLKHIISTPFEILK